MHNKFLDFISKDNTYKNLLNRLGNTKHIGIFKPPVSGIAHLISNLAKDTKQNILYITENPLDLVKQEIENFINIYDEKYKSSSLPSLYNTPYSKVYPPLFKSKERILTFKNLLFSSKNIIITDLLSLFFPLPDRDTAKSYFLDIKKGGEVEKDTIIEKLRIFGYRETDIVNYEGEFSIRGHIIDIFPVNENQPLRIDFEGDEIFRIKYFDPSSQISGKTTDKITIFSINEFLSGKEKKKVYPLIKERWDKFHLKTKYKNLIAYWQDNLYFPKEELFRIFINNNISYNYFKDFLIISDFDNCDIEINKIKEKWRKIYEIEKEKELSIDYKLFFTSKLLDRVKQPDITFTNIFSSDIFQFDYKIIDKKSFKLEKYISKHKDMINIIFTEDKNKKEIILKKLDENLIKNIRFAYYNINEGFNYKKHNISFIPISYIFPEKLIDKEIKNKYKMFFSQFQDLKEGDIVVHANYGIAEYKGIKKEKINGIYNDFLVLEYQGGDKVYVSIDGFSLIYRYSGTDDYKPPLDKLGSKSWAKTKEKVKKGIFKIANDLLKLYAKRKTYTGISLLPDEEIEEEFISLFEYEPTKDQTLSWIEISEDMKKDKPMDRLLCGDVGFGKTEVAIRAAFRAYLNNKQVAVLCPTTILANQHYRTFRDRFKNYSVSIGLLSRMVPNSKRKEIIEKTKNSEIDILIGTHSILSDKVQFGDLGLLIIDEEQRFGVKHKNKILKLKEKIDVLTMTATPIPRTLNMAISGVKALSIIETPPPGRMAIATYIEEINPEIIKEAILSEIKRDGQVFIVYNNIDKITGFKEYIQNLVPAAKVEYLHSKMNSLIIDKTMLRFINNDFNVLISTTIIENGIDIPNVNTLIIMEAERFGLSQLYQLRGRVGRGKRKAYAYFLINSQRLLTDKAKKRLKALKEFQELGSGFRLAAMDLEIRGAGNLLGKEQHGHLKSVGFEYYLWLLNRAIKKLKGEGEEEEFNPEINLPYNYSIPEKYIPQSSQRLNIYKRLSLIKKEKELYKIKDEIIDRFGNLPPEIHNLFFLIKTRIILLKLKIEILSYNIKLEKLRLRFSPLTSLSEEHIDSIIRKYKGEKKSNGLIEFSIQKDKLKIKLIKILNELSDIKKY